MMPIIAESTTYGFMGALILAAHRNVIRKRVFFFPPDLADLDSRISEVLRYQFRGLRDLVTDTEQVFFVGFDFRRNSFSWARDRRRRTAWIWYHGDGEQEFDHDGIIDINMQPPDLIGYLWHEYMNSAIYDRRMDTWFEEYGLHRENLDVLIQRADLPLLLEAARQRDFDSVAHRFYANSMTTVAMAGSDSDVKQDADWVVSSIAVEPQTKPKDDNLTGKADDKDDSVKLIVLDDHTNGQGVSGFQVVSSATSKIYHRTDCKKAKRIKQPKLFDSPELAEAEGKRSCMTCKPKG